jgi:hypothetical protein
MAISGDDGGGCGPGTKKDLVVVGIPCDGVLNLSI